MSKTATYSLISSTTASGSTTSVSFSSIPQTFTDLILVVGSLSLSVNGNGLIVRYNGDSGTNYSLTDLGGTGSAAFSRRISNSTYAQIGWGQIGSQGAKSTIIANFFDYSNTTTYKTSLARWNDSSAEVGTTVSMWRNTGAITSMDVISGANLSSGATFKLYGIEAYK